MCKENSSMHTLSCHIYMQLLCVIFVVVVVVVNFLAGVIAWWSIDISHEFQWQLSKWVI